MPRLSSIRSGGDLKLQIRGVITATLLFISAATVWHKWWKLQRRPIVSKKSGKPLQPLQTKLILPVFERCDGDKDGRLGLVDLALLLVDVFAIPYDEAVPQALFFFHLYNIDLLGSFSREETLSALSAIQSSGFDVMLKQRKARPTVHIQTNSGLALTDAQSSRVRELIERLDTDKDGHISLDQLAWLLRELFGLRTKDDAYPHALAIYVRCEAALDEVVSAASVFDCVSSIQIGGFERLLQRAAEADDDFDDSLANTGNQRHFSSGSPRAQRTHGREGRSRTRSPPLLRESGERRRGDSSPPRLAR